MKAQFAKMLELNSVEKFVLFQPVILNQYLTWLAIKEDGSLHC